MDFEGFPGGDLIRDGLQDLSAGRESAAALLVAVGAPRLRRSGLPIPMIPIDHAEHRLYELLARTHADSAHSRYNALIRRLVSFERTFRRAVERVCRPEGPQLTPLPGSLGTNRAPGCPNRL